MKSMMGRTSEGKREKGGNAAKEKRRVVSKPWALQGGARKWGQKKIKALRLSKTQTKMTDDDITLVDGARVDGWRVNGGFGDDDS